MKINTIIRFLTVLCVLFHFYMRAESPLFASILDAAKKEISLLRLHRDDLRHLIEYMEFFSAWYASVTPAPIELHDALPENALIFVDTMKKIIKPLERKQNRRIIGSTRLTPEGKEMYQKIISLLRIHYADQSASLDQISQ